MEINANFDERVVVHAGKLDWTASPMPGVDRRMLDRLGGEVARATTIVRYAPGSHFSAHVHTGGEEFLVLDGVFQDEHGDFPAGSYIRNPPQSSHTPRSEPGCTIFVKLWQFDMDDRNQVRINTNERQFDPEPTRRGASVMPLYEDDREAVSLEHWEAGAEIALDAPSGLEVLLLEGSFTEGGEEFSEHSWLRLPKAGKSKAVAGGDGAKVWIKRNHLAEAPRPPAVS